jgi:hypothetical protein
MDGGMGLNLPVIALTFARVRSDFKKWHTDATWLIAPPVKPAVTQIKKNVSGKGEKPETFVFGKAAANPLTYVIPQICDKAVRIAATLLRKT